MLTSIPDIIPASQASFSTLTDGALSLRKYYDAGETRGYAFRKKQLQLLKKAIKDHEQEILDALYIDLKKSPEEGFFTEIGLTLAEINTTLKHLHKWMRPKKVTTNLLNFPSKSYLLKDPLGVVFIIAPWNYPFQLCLLPLVGAIAGGNCAILKPSELAPATAAVIEKIITAIFPKQYVFVAQGDGAVVVPALINSFRFDHVFYTGSIAVGKIIYQLAAKDLVPVTLELGGKSPCIVEADADLKTAAKRIVLGKFVNAGQTCIAPDYLLVHESVRQKFQQLLIEAIDAMFTTDASTNYDYGKIINKNRFNKISSYLQQGKILYGGKSDPDKSYISPTLMTDVSLDEPLMKEEIFGPIFPIFPFTNLEEGKKIIAHNPDPLALYLFTNSSTKEKEWLETIAFGGGCVNNAAMHFTNDNLPFGGVRNSGLGRYHGKFSFEVFTHEKAILRTPTWLDPSIKYPPLKGKLKWLKKIFN